MDGASLLFSQHGWADTNRRMLAFGLAVAPPGTEVVATDLGFFRTWQRLEPLVDRVEAEAAAFLEQFPASPACIVGHSMGGLIWLTLLDRHPEWRRRVTSLALIGCPVRGAELAAALDRQGWTIARDLAVDRGEIAARVAATVPTISVAGDLLLASDGTVTLRSARVDGARFVCLPRESHAGLVKSDRVIRLVRAFIHDPHPSPTDTPSLIARLQAVAGAVPSVDRLPAGGKVSLLFPDGANVRVRFPPLGMLQVSLYDPEGGCLWAGSVPRRNAGDLRQALQDLEAHALR